MTTTRFTCKGPGCSAVLELPEPNYPRAQAKARQLGWKRSNSPSGMIYFCTACPAPPPMFPRRST